MTGKERFNAALNGEKTDRPAFMEIEFQLYEELLGEDPVVGYSYGSLSAAAKENALKRNAELFVNAAEQCGHDVIRDICGYWESAPGHPALLWLPTLEDRVQFVREVKKLTGESACILATVCSPFSIPAGDEMLEFVEQLYDEPELLAAQFKEKTDTAIRIGDALLEAGADGIINTADAAFNSGTFLSLTHMEKFFFPEFDRWCEHMKKRGAISVWHTDGNITKVLPYAKASGVRAVQCIDPIAGMDLAQTAAELGDSASVIGNINCSVLQLGTEEEICAEVRRVFSACEGRSNWVFGCCNAVFKGIPIANYQILLSEFRRQSRAAAYKGALL